MGTDEFERLSAAGATLLRASDAAEAHDEFEDWCQEVGRWLDSDFPGSGYSALWAGLGQSFLAVGGRYFDSPGLWVSFRKVVQKRLTWLGNLPERLARSERIEPREKKRRLPPDFDRSVFINFPFDEEFRPLRDAAVFSVLFLGYHVRCALDTADGSRVRIEKLFDLIRSSRLGIHDLSRTELDETNQLPRFNMPLELGVFLGIKDSGGPDQARKVALITCVEPYVYQKFLSDVAGQDAVPHFKDPERFIGVIRDWLATLGEEQLPSPSRVCERYRHFQAELPNLCRKNRQSPEELTYRDYLRHVDAFCSGPDDALVVQGEHKIESPTPSDLKNAVWSLDGGENSFAILEKGGSGLTYMQTVGGQEEGYDLEIQEGSTDAHFLCVTPDLDRESVFRAFTLYSEDDPSWREEFEWEPMEIVSRST